MGREVRGVIVDYVLHDQPETTSHSARSREVLSSFTGDHQGMGAPGAVAVHQARPQNVALRLLCHGRFPFEARFGGSERAPMSDVRLVDAKLSDVVAAVAAVSERQCAMLVERLDAALDAQLRADPLELMDAKAVAALLGTSVRELRRGVREGSIVAPLKIGKRRIRWRRTDLVKWLDAGRTKS